MCDSTSIDIYKSNEPRFYAYIMCSYIGSYYVLTEEQGYKKLGLSICSDVTH